MTEELAVEATRILEAHGFTAFLGTNLPLHYEREMTTGVGCLTAWGSDISQLHLQWHQNDDSCVTIGQFDDADSLTEALGHTIRYLTAIARFWE